MKRQGGQLVKVGSLFEKYQKNLKPPQRTVEKACQETILEVLNITIATEQITYTVSTRTVYVQVPSILKNEIKMNANEILTALRERLGVQGTPTTLL